MKKTLAVVVLGALFATTVQAADHLDVASKKGKFEDVRDDLVMAIENRGLKITHTNHISDMLTRTGAAVGDTRPVFGQAEQMEFCKADLSREMMLADPSNIVFCPYIISVYSKPGQPDRIFVAYRKPLATDASPSTQKALADLEALLSGIVKDTIQGSF